MGDCGGDDGVGGGVEVNGNMGALGEVAQFVAAIRIQALKATHRTALAQLDALFASLQQRAFAGEL